MSNEPGTEMETGWAMISFTEEEKTLNTITGKLLQRLCFCPYSFTAAVRRVKDSTTALSWWAALLQYKLIQDLWLNNTPEVIQT